MLCTAMASGRVALLAQPPAPVLPPGATEAAPVPMSKLRQEVIGMLFKSLTCRTPEIVNASKAGLEQVISQHKLQKGAPCRELSEDTRVNPKPSPASLYPPS